MAGASAMAACSPLIIQPVIALAVMRMIAVPLVGVLAMGGSTVGSICGRWEFAASEVGKRYYPANML